MNIVLFSSGAANADTIIELPVGTFKVKFQMKKQTRNTLGKRLKEETEI